MVGITPFSSNATIVLAQSKKKNPAQASKYAKRGSAKAKKKDYRGALSDYKKAYQLNPTSNYKKRVQQLTSLAKKVVAAHLKNHQKNRYNKQHPMPRGEMLKLRKKIMQEH